MSFWSENKQTFKSAGIATAKGIGSGTKTLSKAGYNTYKKNDAARKGLPPPGDNSKLPPPPMAPAAPLMDKEKLLALPAPPKRTVPVHDAPTRGSVAPRLNVQSQSKSNNVPQVLPRTADQNAQLTQQPTPVPVQQGQALGPPPPLPQQRQQQSVPVPLPERQSTSIFLRPAMPMPTLEPGPPPREPTQGAPASIPAPQANANVPVADSVVQPPLQQRATAPQSPEPTGPRVPKPAPDASMFAPPPVHKNRGNFDSKPAHSVGSGSVSRPVSSSGGGSGVNAAGAPPSLPSRSSSTSSAQQNGPDLSSPPPSYTEIANETPSNTGSSRSEAEPQPPRSSVRYVEIDVSKFGPPPPRRVDAPMRTVSRPESVASSRSSVPPPPLPPTKPVSATSTASNPPPVPDAEETVAKPKKVPPPKPAKLQKPESQPLSQQSTSTHAGSSDIGTAEVIEQPKVPATPNFAAEIARLKLQKPQVPTTQTEESNIKPQRPVKPIKPSLSQKSVSSEPEEDQKSVSPRPNPPIKPPKPQKPCKPIKPSGISLATKGSSESEDTTPEDSKKDSPNPLVIPVSQRRYLTPEQRIPGFRVPVKGQFHHKPPEKPVASEGVENSDSADKDSKPHPKPLVIPLTSGPDVSNLPKPDLPGFRVPVKGKSHAEGSSTETGSSTPDSNQSTVGNKPVVPASRITLIDQNVSTSSRSTPPLAPPSRNSRNVSAITSSSSTPPPPPPTRNYVRAAVPVPPQPQSPPQLDLELSTGWYASTTQLNLPVSLSGLNYSTSYQVTTKNLPSGTMTLNSRSIEVRFKDLSKAKFNINWLDNNFSNATLECTEFTPSPIDNKSPSKKELWEYSEKFGNYITSWCLHKEGQKVGSGECWDLAKEALAKGCGKHAFISQYYHHGYPILELLGNPSGASISKGPEDEIRPGDILQFKLATLHSKTTGVTQTVGSPDHTSVVYEKDKDVIRVLEQNVQGVKIVRKGEYILSNMVSGSVTVYRPVPAEWAE